MNKNYLLKQSEKGIVIEGIEKVYKVPVTWSVAGDVSVPALDFKMLKTCLVDENFVDCMPVVRDNFYIDDSYEIDWDELACRYKEEILEEYQKMQEFSFEILQGGFLEVESYGSTEEIDISIRLYRIYLKQFSELIQTNPLYQQNAPVCFEEFKTNELQDMDYLKDFIDENFISVYKIYRFYVKNFD